MIWLSALNPDANFRPRWFNTVEEVLRVAGSIDDTTDNNIFKVDDETTTSNIFNVDDDEEIDQPSDTE